MDVLCVGMYRACSTWQYDVACHLLERHRSARRLGYVMGAEYGTLRQVHLPSTWRVLKSHDEDPRFVRALKEGRALALYSYRDLRDVAFSLAHKRGTTLEGIVAQGMVHQVLANDRCWMSLRESRRLVQGYEALVADPAQGVRELAAFLGLVLVPGEAEAAAREYSLEANRQRTGAIGRRLRAQGIDLADPAHVQEADEHTLLHWNHLREGRVGGWRDEATPGQRALLGRLCADWLIARGYEQDRAWVGEAAGPGAILPREALLTRAWMTYQMSRQARLRPRLAATVRRMTGLATGDGPQSGMIHKIRGTHDQDVTRRAG
jgi:hypothetical protein